MADAALRLTALAQELLGEPLPVRVRAWDGSESGPPGAPVLVIKNRRALRRLLWKPGELGLARAWVAGELDIEGDLYEALDLMAGLVWERGTDVRTGLRSLRDPRVRDAAKDLLKLSGPWLPPAPPPEEVRRRGGALHTRRRDKEAISHHYDVGNDFYELVLGPSMVYSCAYWEDGGNLEDAQRDKLDLVCRKLALKEDDRLLDVGCGWGSMAIHAAREYGARVTGVTLSVEQAAFARKRIAEEGLTDRIEIRVQDYRETADGPFDAVSSVGMAEHVGVDRIPGYMARLFELLRPGGRLLHHAIAWNAGERSWDADTFIARYVFPDGELLSLAAIVGALEGGGFEVLDVEALRRHYALTLRAWVQRLEEHWAEAAASTSEGRARVWRLYMAASALGFESGQMGVNQVLVQRPGGEQPPLRRTGWV